MSSTAAMSPTLPAAARAVRAQFFVAGALFATLGVHVPSLKAHYALGEQAIAIALLASGLGAVLALPQAGRLLAWRSPRQWAVPLALACAAVVAALLASERYAALLVLMLAYGMAAALFDVAINDEASALEQRAGRPLMSGFHGMFSLGGMAGSAAWSVLATLGMAPRVHLVWTAMALFAVAAVASRWMLRDPRQADAPRAPLSLPRGPLLLLGVLAAMGLVAEGAMYDWSVLYLRQDLGAPTGIASLGYACFSAAMAVGRFCGDRVRARWSPLALLRGSGLLGAAGMALALVVPHPAAALGGFAMVGLGFANIVPVLFSVAGRLPGIAAAHGIASVSAVGYAGMMAGPPLVGFVAEGRSLRAGLLVVVLFAVLVALGARAALERAQVRR